MGGQGWYMQAHAPDWPGPVNKNLGPGPVNTNWGSGSLNTNWGPGPVNTNWGPGPVNIGGQGRGPGNTSVWNLFKVNIKNTRITSLRYISHNILVFPFFNLNNLRRCCYLYSFLTASQSGLLDTVLDLAFLLHQERRPKGRDLNLNRIYTNCTCLNCFSFSKR